MKKEEDQSTSPAIIASRAKKGLALATGNPLDKIVVGPPQVDKKAVQSEETLIERVVSMMQRRKRALQMKRSKPRITRARNIKRTRLATQDQLMRRAMRMAKTMLRKRAAGARGANYNNLSPAQKMNIDRQIEPRTKNIKAIATRLMPRVKAGEMKRLNAVRTHKSTKGVYGNVQNLTQSYEPVIYSKLLGEKISREDLNAMFSMYEGFVSSALAPVRLATKIVGGAAATVAALQSPQSTAAGLGAATLYGYKKLSNLGKDDPGKKKQEKSDKYSDKMNQQSLIQSRERTKQAQLKTKQMQQKPAISSSPEPSSVRSTPAPKQQIQSAPKQQTTPVAPAAQQQTSNKYTPPSDFAQRISQMNKNKKGLVNHKEWDYESYLQEKAAQHLQKKAEKYGASLEEVTNIFEQGLADYVQNDRNTPHQFAMQRVNSYLTFAFHPSVEEDIGAGFEGTNQLTNKYKKDTPGEAVEAFGRMMRAKRKANTPC
jgi:hypothetical protein